MKLIHSVWRSFRWSVNSIVQRLRHCIAAQPQHNDRWAVCDQGWRAGRRHAVARWGRGSPWKQRLPTRSRRSSPSVHRHSAPIVRASALPRPHRASSLQAARGVALAANKGLTNAFVADCVLLCDGHRPRCSLPVGSSRAQVSALVPSLERHACGSARCSACSSSPRAPAALVCSRPSYPQVLIAKTAAHSAPTPPFAPLFTPAQARTALPGRGGAAAAAVWRQPA